MTLFNIQFAFELFIHTVDVVSFARGDEGGVSDARCFQHKFRSEFEFAEAGLPDLFYERVGSCLVCVELEEPFQLARFADSCVRESYGEIFDVAADTGSRFFDSGQWYEAVTFIAELWEDSWCLGGWRLFSEIVSRADGVVVVMSIYYHKLEIG